MAVINYLDYNGLKKYDELIKQLIAQSIKTVKLNGDTLEFYKSANPGPEDPADYEITVSGTGDLSQLIKKVADAKANNIPVLTEDGSIADSGISINGIGEQTITFDVID